MGINDNDYRVEQIMTLYDIYKTSTKKSTEQPKSSCKHDYVNVSLMHVKLVCRHCDEEKKI